MRKNKYCFFLFFILSFSFNVDNSNDKYNMPLNRACAECNNIYVGYVFKLEQVYWFHDSMFNSYYGTQEQATGNDIIRIFDLWFISVLKPLKGCQMDTVQVLATNFGSDSLFVIGKKYIIYSSSLDTSSNKCFDQYFKYCQRKVVYNRKELKQIRKCLKNNGELIRKKWTYTFRPSIPCSIRHTACGVYLCSSPFLSGFDGGGKRW